MSALSAEAIIQELELAPHPEGGFYRETWRGSLVVDGLPHGAPRAAHTAIYFLLPSGTFSALHRVKSDEVWHHYDGDVVDLHLIDDAGAHRSLVLGRELSSGARPQHVVPAGVWQAAVPRGTTLCGCTVAPGFDFADFEMPPRDVLTRAFPSHAALVERLTRA